MQSNQLNRSRLSIRESANLMLQIFVYNSTSRVNSVGIKTGHFVSKPISLIERVSLGYFLAVYFYPSIHLDRPVSVEWPSPSDRPFRLKRPSLKKARDQKMIQKMNRNWNYSILGHFKNKCICHHVKNISFTCFLGHFIIPPVKCKRIFGVRKHGLRVFLSRFRLNQ